ncbi:MAG: 4-hydroxy-tetrahydrodipicolinate reductase [Nitrospirae bacterium]|nr:4-hydroxy-tetrahydrodipicolinate reductase [Nitrospirota bacterium]
MIRLIVCGAAGKMGRRILALALQDPKRFRVVGAVERKGHPDAGKDIGALAGVPTTGLALSADLGSVLGPAAVVVDFTRPDSAVNHARLCRTRKTPIVIGTTGIDGPQRRELQTYARAIPILLAPNMSAGVNVMFKLAADAAIRLAGYDAEIVETHHRHKVDAPSGTALRLGEAIAESRGVAFEKVARFERHGQIGARREGEIGVQSLRAGDVVGDHTVLFSGPGESIEITHRAHSRDVFAHGALRAAEWMAARKPGLYEMADVLGLK